MDALILSCGTGGGHDSAARAILEAMNARGHHAEMLNPYIMTLQNELGLQSEIQSLPDKYRNARNERTSHMDTVVSGSG